MNLCTSFIAIISFNRECWFQKMISEILHSPRMTNPHTHITLAISLLLLLTINKLELIVADGGPWFSSYEGHARSLMWKRSRFSNTRHADNDLHEKYGAKQLLHGPFFITNNMCANFHTSLDSFIVLIDCLAPSVNASLPFALISNSGSDGLYPSITVTSVAAGHSWSVGVCRHYH